MRRVHNTIRFTKEPYVEDIGPRKIESIRFSTMSESEILKNAEVQVYRGFLYDKDRVPIEGGLLDSRMGPTSKYEACSTCHGSWEQCPGHFGYMSLTLPVYNAAFLDTVVDILKCICKNCARTLLAEKERLAYLKQMRNPKLDAKKKKELFKMIAKRCTALASQGECSRCNYINGPVKKAVGEIGIIHNRTKVIDGSLDARKDALSHINQSGSIITSSSLQPYTVYDLLKRMTDEDCEMLSVCERPEQLMIKNIAVPPIVIRPSVFVGGGMSNENDITERLKRIIQTNACLHQEISGASAPKNLAMLLDLQTEVAQYINSELRVPLHMQNARPLSGLIQRLKGKEGRIRGTLSGKRVEFTGRTVISPDPNLKVTEVGIPMLMARILTFPERVSHHNIEKLRQCVQNGRNIYPGATLIRWKDGTVGAVLDHLKTRFASQLKIGDVVERHLENGDAVLFNRQPSLHRMSIMCHRAKIMPWRTLRFNESVCNPYNADFDGDEMNIHVPQTEEARAEALTLMGVQSNLCIPKNGDILVASTQDFLTSSYLITRKDTFYDRASFSLICCYMGDAMDPIDLPTPALLKPVELWTGKQLFSVLLRPHANMRVYTNLSVMEKTYTKSRETMCPNDGFVCFRNSELVSGQVGKATLGNGNKNGLYCILLRDYNAHGAAVCINRLAKLSARWIGNHGFSIGIDDVQPGKRLNENKRKRISEGYECCDKLISDYNRGSPKQQPRSDSALALESEITKVLNTIRETTAKVCMEELDWRNSPLIMSQCGSKGSPINVSQMIACVGQQSVGGKRALNGFIDRSLPHFHPNSKTPDAKGFVANSFYSGLTATEFFFHTMGGREGLVDSAVKTASTGYMSRRLVKGLEDLSVHHDNTVRDASNSIVQFVYGDDGLDPAQMEDKNGFPLNFDRLLSKAKAICPAGNSAGMLASEIFEAFNDKLSEFDTSPDGGCSQAFRHKLSEFLTKCRQIPESKSVARSKSGITHRQLEVFLDTCISRYRVKKVDAGTAIGAIGAQSIGEPGTQMTLKTFHFAGVASMNVTLGVPRLEEIVNAAKKISTPIITTHLECYDNEKIARLVKGRIEKTYLGQVAKSIQLVMTTRSASIIITLDFGVIQDAHLSIDSHTVRQSILKTPKIKLKEEHVKVLDCRKLEVTAPTAGTSKLHFELHRIKNKLLSVIVQGISSAERVIINKMTNNKTKKENYELLVEGKGLLAVMGTEGVRASLTKSNDIIEVQNTLGIEAARAKIIDEMQNMMKAYDMSIDIRHFMLLADLMTCKGETKGLTRYGIVKDSVISNASFEKTADHFSDASVQSRVDKIAGVSESIIVGMPVQLGTGMLQLRQRVPPVELTYNLDPIFA